MRFVHQSLSFYSCVAWSTVQLYLILSVLVPEYFFNHRYDGYLDVVWPILILVDTELEKTENARLPYIESEPHISSELFILLVIFSVLGGG